MDVEYDNIGENKYDAVYARFGTQFFINPVKGFKNMCKVKSHMIGEPPKCVSYSSLLFFRL